MAGMIIDVIAGKKPDADPLAEAGAAADETAAETEPEGGPEALISSIESQLAELRAMMADLG